MQHLGAEVGELRRLAERQVRDDARVRPRPADRPSACRRRRSRSGSRARRAPRRRSRPSSRTRRVRASWSRPGRWRRRTRRAPAPGPRRRAGRSRARRPRASRPPAAPAAVCAPSVTIGAACIDPRRRHAGVRRAPRRGSGCSSTRRCRRSRRARSARRRAGSPVALSSARRSSSCAPISASTSRRGLSRQQALDRFEVAPRQLGDAVEHVRVAPAFALPAVELEQPIGDAAHRRDDDHRRQPRALAARPARSRQRARSLRHRRPTCRRIS